MKVTTLLLSGSPKDRQDTKTSFLTSWHKLWGERSNAPPRRSKFTCKSQLIPTNPHLCPIWGVVGHNIDRCWKSPHFLQSTGCNSLYTYFSGPVLHQSWVFPGQVQESVQEILPYLLYCDLAFSFSSGVVSFTCICSHPLKVWKGRMTHNKAFLQLIMTLQLKKPLDGENYNLATCLLWYGCTHWTKPTGCIREVVWLHHVIWSW